MTGPSIWVLVFLGLPPAGYVPLPVPLAKCQAEAKAFPIGQAFCVTSTSGTSKARKEMQ